jgi:hypothetical protein
MQLPFDAEQFLQLFAAYNRAIWPFQFVLVGAALAALYVAVRPDVRSERAPAFLLAALWVWSGAVYHLMFFRQINPAASLFGALFLSQAVVLLALARRRRLVLRFSRSVAGWAGAALIAYALVLYPILGALLGHTYPAMPTFGAPCPVTIFTFGLLLWNVKRTPWYAVAIPVFWSVVGSSAAITLGMREDLGLPVAAAITLVAALATHVRNRRRTVHKLRPAG